MTTTPKAPTSKAFSGRTESNIRGVIQMNAHKQYKLTRHRVLPAELLNLFVDPEYHTHLTAAYSLNQPSYVQNIFVDVGGIITDRYRVVSGRLSFSWWHFQVPSAFFAVRDSGGDAAFPLRHPREGAHETILRRYEGTLRRMLDISYEWGLVMHVFDQLNQPTFCSTPAQMRYVWPSILLLLKEVGGPQAENIFRSIQHVSSRAGDAARIPLGIADFVREAYTIVTKATFLEGEPEDKTANGIQYTLQKPKFSAKDLSFDGLE